MPARKTNPLAEFGLGRRHVTDGRDRRFPMASQLPRKSSGRTSRYWWQSGWWGDQGATNQCVAYAWDHWLEDGPITQRSTPRGKVILDPAALYRRALQLDEIPGEVDEGTTVRGGAKVLQQEGLIESYHWALSTSDVIRCLLDVGPLVVGTDWYYGMFFPDGNGVVKPTGYLAGGHAYLANGINVNREMIRFKNSWSRNWGHHGGFWMSFQDFDALLRANGEACLAVEVQR